MRLLLFLVACGPGSPPLAPDDAPPDDTVDDDSVADDSEAPSCAPGVPGCDCVVEPTDAAAACWHPQGGRYGDGACSGTNQCCSGAWSPPDTCSTCGCTESTGTTGCVPAGAGVLTCFPAFEATLAPLSDDMKTAMTGKSWDPGCPVGLDELSLVTMTHWGFDGAVHTGDLVVATAVASEVRDIFAHAYAWRVPIERMEPVYLYDGDDDASMAVNNTSAFNCRAVTGGSSWSKHSYGDAIDINPIQNPYVRGTTVLPPAGSAYTDRAVPQQGMILSPGPLAGAFLSRGWDWGGQWSSLQDYQHFSKSGG